MNRVLHASRHRPWPFLGGLILPLLFATGCGARARNFEHQDRAAVRTAFVEAVNLCYKDRRDGVLQAPTFDANRVRFVFLYGKEVDGMDSECADLTFARLRGHDGRKEVYRVLAYHPLRGPNRVMEEQTRRLEQMLQERLAAPK